MLFFVTLLLVCQLLGEVAVRLVNLPIPGPVVGLVLLFAGLWIRGGEPPAGLQQVTRGLLENLSLLFVPAGVGVMLHLSLVRAEWLPILGALIGSAIATIAVTALLMTAVARLTDAGPTAEETKTDEPPETERRS
jgi:holin-like protein